MTNTKVTPGTTPLTSTQKVGLELVSRLSGGRDVVLAIDLTSSVGLNDEGRTRLRQIVEDSIKPGDFVYVIPFGSDVVLKPENSSQNPLVEPVKFTNNLPESTQQVLAKIALVSDPNLANTDIQKAELIIYQGLAQLNQNRLQQNQGVKPQSVVWITDAPILTSPGINSSTWIETPAQSPFRIISSSESQERQSWIQALPIQKRSLVIQTKNQNLNGKYNLSVVDITATVQEFCTPAPGGAETCLVNPYLLKQLWLPGLISGIFLVLIILGIFKALRLQKKWELIVDFEVTAKPEDQKCRLPHNKKIAIGTAEHDSKCIDSINCPGSEVRGYLERQGEKLYLVPTGNAPVYYHGKEVLSRILICNWQFRINCPDVKKRDYEIVFKVIK